MPRESSASSRQWAPRGRDRLATASNEPLVLATSSQLRDFIRDAVRVELASSIPAIAPARNVETISVKEAADMCSLKEATVREHARSGAFVAQRPRGSREWRIDLASFKAWLAGQGEVVEEPVDLDATARRILERRGR